MQDESLYDAICYFFANYPLMTDKQKKALQKVKELIEVNNVMNNEKEL